MVPLPPCLRPGSEEGTAPSQPSLSLVSAAHAGPRTPCPLQSTLEDSQPGAAACRRQEARLRAEGRGRAPPAGQEGLPLAPGLVGRQSTSGTRPGVEAGLRIRPLNPKVMGRSS